MYLLLGLMFSTCVCVCARARARVCASAGDSVSARVLCFSVSQLHFALYKYV